jgi:signal transduction histidine kinase
MQLIVHGTQSLFSEVQALFEGYAYVDVSSHENTKISSGVVVHLAEKASEFAPLSEHDLAVVLENPVHQSGVLSCPRSDDGSLSGALVRLVENLGASNFMLKQRLEEFLSVFHHDISEPARNMAFFAQFLNSERGNDEEKKKDLLERINVSGQRLQLLVADLTRYARSWVKENPSESLSAEAVATLCQESFSRSKEKAERLFEELETDSMLGVKAPAKFVSAIFQELFANALEYHGHEGDPIRLSVHRNDTKGTIEFSVIDDGPGIIDPGEDRLFRPFYRGKRDDELRTGMGLAMVRSMVEQSGGEIWLKVSETRETCDLYFSLPAL